MRIRLLSLVVLIAFTTNIFAATTADFYVSPSGNDAWSGKLAAPNAQQSDGPFATFQRAQKAVRDTRAAEPTRAKLLTVLFRAGTYALATPITITPAESGSANSPTVYEAYEKESVTLSGGRPITNWKNAGNNQWTTQIDHAKDGKWAFIQLFVNGQRRYRPRLPKDGYYAIADEMEPSEKAQKKGYDRFKFAGADINPAWHDLNRVEVIGFHVWTMSRLPILSVDNDNKVVTFTGQTRALTAWNKLPKNGRYFVENVKEALSPGTFYLDRATGTLTYMPLPGEDMTKAEVIAPKLESLVTIAGDAQAKKPVSHVTLRGLTFAHTNWETPAAGNSYPQAEINVPGAVTLTAAIDCSIEQCNVTKIGHYAIDVGAACQRIRIEGCELTDIGAGGIKIGTTRVGRSGSWDSGTASNDSPEITSHVTVKDNLIAGLGRLHPAAVGVWIGQSPNNEIAHNEITDLYYTGISMGWTWGYGPALAQNNNIHHNLIHHVGQRVLSDMGGIYTLGNAKGTVLHHNVIHDVDSFDYGGWGIYPDEGTTDMLVENNVCYRTKTGNFHQHYGKENVVRNNIFAFSRQWQIQRTRPEPHLSFTFERNIVLWNTGPLLGSNWKDNNYKLDHNLYWHTEGKPIDFASMPIEKWREKGQDVNSLIADPMFVDPQNGNFTLKPGSPAEKIGFKPIDVSTVGRLTRKATPKALPAAFPDPGHKK